MVSERVASHVGAAIVVGAVGAVAALVIAPAADGAVPALGAVGVGLPALALLLHYDPAPERYEPVLWAGVAVILGAVVGLLAAVGYLLSGGGVPGSVDRLAVVTGTTGGVLGGLAFVVARRRRGGDPASQNSP